MTSQGFPPLLFTFGLHAHQPEGNFGHVFEEHFRDVYEPFLQRAVEGELLPLTLHFSGPLLDWLKAHRPAYLDLVGRLASEGRLELLLAGYYEPILPSLPPADRIEQVRWMREALVDLFGVEATGLWLTERVWEPDLAADLADAGVEYVLLDDRHFVAAGLSREHLHSPFRTESHGKSLGVFAIDEKLRYTIPFHPPRDTSDYLRALRSRGCRLAVAADDIEKFGGWPGTREWVYDRGWLESFTREMTSLQEAGEIRLATFSQALREVPSAGLVYLPSASYREMEEWSLPAEGIPRLAELKALLGEERFARGESPLIRGSHWRNFLVKYPEANRMHKKMLTLSELCRARGNPEAPRRALGRAQCNDAYWHGVFGGLYLRHLRNSVWKNLAEAEGLLRSGEGLGWEERDLDLDGHAELWIHSRFFSALVSPRRGGGVEELTWFDPGVNLADTLTRRREAYHLPSTDPEERAQTPPVQEEGDDGSGGTPSIHDLEEGLRFAELPPVDPASRAIFLEQVLANSISESDYSTGRYQPLHSWAQDGFEVERVAGIAQPDGPDQSPLGPDSSSESDPTEGQQILLSIRLTARGAGSLTKVLEFRNNGGVEARFAWDPSSFPPDGHFCTEISLGADARLTSLPEAEVWRFPITTFSKSERGFDETVQGESILFRWPITEGEARVRIGRRPAP